MPKQTFFNLPEDKRQRILDAALEEFATRPFGKASLSKIVATAGIAKGSMYQYFEDKKDLFMYLLSLAGQQKLAYIEQEVDPKADFFTAFEQSIYAGTRFNLEHPVLSRVIANMMEPSGEEMVQALFKQAKEMSIDWYEKMINRGIQEGSLRPDLDVKLTANLLYAVMKEGLTDYILETLNVDMSQLLANPDIARRLTDENIRHMVTQVVTFLRTGLTNNKVNPTSIIYQTFM